VIVYLANVGTRDVTLDGRPLPLPRPDGERLLRAYLEYPEAFGHRLDAPILLPGLLRAIRVAGSVDRLVLFVSDQPEGVAPEHRDRDTVHLGELLRLWLPRCAVLGGGLGEVRVVAIPGNPADYSTAILFYERALPGLVPDGARTVYVAPVGGADASNTGLWLASVRLFRARVEAIYVMPGGRVEQIPLARVLLRDQAVRQACALLEYYDYSGLASLLAGVPWWGGAWHPLFARAMSERLHFNFWGAVRLLDQAAEKAGGEERAWIGRMSDSLRRFARCLESGGKAPASGDPEPEWTAWLERHRTGLAELYWNMLVKARRAEWVDFLGRAFRLYEGVLRLVFEETTRHSTCRGPSGRYPDFAGYVAGDEGLVSYLRSKGVRAGEDGVSWEPSTYVLKLVVEYWTERERGAAGFLPVRGMCLLMERLAQLRNASIMAHGWDPVSRDEMERQAGMGIEEVLERIRRGLKAGGVETGEENPYDQANDWFRARLEAEHW
jgi:hypothetical protein